jgi:hypothetical protein
VPRIPLRRSFAAMMMPKSPQKLLFSTDKLTHIMRLIQEHSWSNLNAHKLSPVMTIEDKEKPAYLLGYAYAPMLHAPRSTQPIYERTPNRISEYPPTPTVNKIKSVMSLIAMKLL